MFKINFFVIFVPALLGYAIHASCPQEEDTGANVEFRPPGWFFKTVWPILYLLMGISWFIELGNKDKSQFLTYSAYLLLSLCLAMWIFVYACEGRKKEGVWVLGAAIFLTLYTYTLVERKSKLLLTPLLTWLILALLLNAFEVQEEKNHPTPAFQF